MPSRGREEETRQSQEAICTKICPPEPGGTAYSAVPKTVAEEARPVRIAAPRFPAAMREALRWDRGVRTYADLERLYAERASGREEGVVTVRGADGLGQRPR